MRLSAIAPLICATLAAGGGAPGQTPGVPADSLLEPLPMVEAASLHAQTMEEAPASVTVVTAREIARYGYRSLAEVLASVRGLYTSYDRMYHFVGVRGVGIPGDYNTRFLVMLNGHALTDNLLGANTYFGNDFSVPMDLVERIEVIRGPSSALYGSNGIFATVNVVTRSPVDAPRATASVETGSFGEKKAFVSTSAYLGRGANLLFAGTVFNNRGQDLYFPELDTPAANGGRAEEMDGERGYQSYLNLIWRDWSFTGLVTGREKEAPLAFLPEANHFATRGNRITDTRRLFIVSHSLQAGGARLRARFSLDHFANRDRFDFPIGPGTFTRLQRQMEGSWLNSEWTWQRPVKWAGTVTLGVQGRWDLVNRQELLATSPVKGPLRPAVVRPDRAAAFFVQQERALSRRWKLALGLRYDDTRNFRAVLAPRVSLIHELRAGSVIKFLYGHPFRNPTTLEQYFESPGLLEPAAALRPETAHTGEVVFEKKLRPELTLAANAFFYRMSDLIVTLPLLIGPGYHYQNSAAARTAGLELELRGRPSAWLEMAASWVWQQSRQERGGLGVANSPPRMGSFRAGIPLLARHWGERVWVSAGVRYLGPRFAAYGGKLRPVLLAEATLATVRLHRDFDVSCGVRNALNWDYDHPVGLALDRMQADGRSLFVKLIWRSGE